MKERLYIHCLAIIDERISTLQSQLDDLRRSAECEDKSTAGDKHETGRAMIHLEQEQLQKQLAEFHQQVQNLRALKHSPDSDMIQNGSVVHTNKGLFYIATGLGKIVFDDQEIFVISAASPLGKAFLGKKSGDLVVLGNQHYEILGRRE